MKPALPDDLSSSSDFRRDLRLDSLDLVELVARIERRLAVMIPDEDLPQLVSLEAFARYLERRAVA